MKLVHLCERWLVVDKPPGWVVVPGRGSHPVLREALEAECGRIWVVHRLDAPVSGLILFARTRDAHREANRAFEARAVEKTYEALTAGTGSSATWEWPLAQGKKRVFVADHGKASNTCAVALRRDERGQLWRLRPRTGRRHQLRVHAMTAGHPIHGDALYGSEISWKDGIALRAVRLALELPGLPPLLEVPGLCETIGT
ncbi:MAG TPA: RNA pseudouridine synthase [Myxococcota bacterium]|nr:RNA pseudouridine synthase [Myxococcota bacterium]